MKVLLSDLQATCQTLLKVRGLTDQEGALVAEHFIDAELRGHKTHGVAKFLTMNQAIRERGGRPFVTSDNGVVIQVDGNRELGALGASFCVDQLLARAKVSGVAVVVMRNVGRYGCIYPFGKQIADAGRIGIIMNSGGPATVAPPGSYAPILGSNPFCLAFPRRGAHSLVIDMATSDTAWSHSFIGFVEGYDLPPDTFFDREGNFTTRPQSARSLKPFGGPKGYAICLALEIICGAFLGGKMGTALKNDYECGFLFMALDPAYFRGDATLFYDEMEAFAAELKGAPVREGETPVRLPGDGSEASREAALAAGYVDLNDYTWDVLNRMTLDPLTGFNLGVGRGFR